MRRQLSFSEYRGIDLTLFAVILCIAELLIVTAARFWYADQLYTVSAVAAVVAIVLMRWGPWAGIHAVLGFSAGGHLAASLGTLWHRQDLGVPANARPDALVLCYPVITTGPFAHPESIEHVTGGDPKLMELLSLEKQVRGDMPPCFLWHCVGDEAVPVENSLLLASAMQRSGVDYECHLFAGGAHGISMCNREVETPNPEAAAWVELCKIWLNKKFNYTP